MGGTFHIIERDGRIEYTFAWNDGREQSAVVTLVTATFTEQDGRIIPRFRQEPCMWEGPAAIRTDPDDGRGLRGARLPAMLTR